MTLPNCLTLIRILLTPLLALLLLEHRMVEALGVFFIAGLTDGLDGLLARLLNQRSQLGAYLDPLADKLLLITSFVLLGGLGTLPDWLVVLAVSRDLLIIIGLATVMFHHIPIKIRPVLTSKLTTLFQLITVLAAMGSAIVTLPSYVYSALYAVTALFTLASGAQYVRMGISILGPGKINGDA